ncbi:MAG: hypothetical protein HY262_12690 [Chloroflexi bacterium]|nr:hypothetical protein [Chloroflexota bacterium]
MAARIQGTSDGGAGQRDLALVAVTVVGLSRLVEPPLVWLVAALLLGAVVLGALQVLADELAPAEAESGVPIEALILPAVAAVACVGAIRLIPFGLWLAPALALTWLLVRRALALEARINRATSGLTADDQTAALVMILLISFIGFSGVAAMVPGALIGPPDPRGTLPETNLLVLAIGDGIIAGLLGFRAVALRVPRLSDALWSAGTYMAAIAIGAAALRAMEIPRLVGPALLTLAVYLWDALTGTTPARRRELRWLWQFGLLAALGVVVTAWNLMLRS